MRNPLSRKEMIWSLWLWVKVGAILLGEPFYLFEAKRYYILLKKKDFTRKILLTNIRIIIDINEKHKSL